MGLGLVVLLGFSALLLGGCSDDVALPEADLDEARRLVDDRAEAASIDLSEEDLTCAVERLTPADLEGLRGAAEQPDVEAVRGAAEAVVDCVGVDLIGASVLRSQAGAVSESSLECAVDELDRRFVVDLVAGSMVGSTPRVRAELEVARVLSICLELDELLP